MYVLNKESGTPATFTGFDLDAPLSLAVPSEAGERGPGYPGKRSRAGRCRKARWPAGQAASETGLCGGSK